MNITATIAKTRSLLWPLFSNASTTATVADDTNTFLDSLDISTILDRKDSNLLQDCEEISLPKCSQSVTNDGFDRARWLIISCKHQLSNYKLTRLLGYGTFGVVVESISKKSNTKVAIKIARKSQIRPTEYAVDTITEKRSLKEIEMLKRCSKISKHVIQFVDAWEDNCCHYIVTAVGGSPWNTISIRKNIANQLNLDSIGFDVTNNSFYSTSMEYSMVGFLRACGGFSNERNDIIARGQSVVPCRIQVKIIEQMLRALNELHSHGIIHRDIKDENVLIDNNFCIKLIDFGHAVQYQSGTGNVETTFDSYGTSLFAPPEIRTGNLYVGPEADIYALGLMIYEMNYGDLPKRVEKVSSLMHISPFDFGELSGFSHPMIRNLCKSMLHPNPKERPSAHRCLEILALGSKNMQQ